MEGKPLPEFDLTLTDSTNFNTKNIIPSKQTIIMFISPICPFCKAQTKEIIENSNKFDSVSFYIISNAPLTYMKQYSDQFNLNKYPNITVAYDGENYFQNRFQINSVPYLAIYNKDKILKQVLIGKSRAALIKDILSD